MQTRHSNIMMYLRYPQSFVDCEVGLSLIDPYRNRVVDRPSVDRHMVAAI